MKNTNGKDHLKRTQKDYSLAFKLQVVDEIEKGYLTYKESQKKVWHPRQKHSFGLATKTWYLRLEI